MSGQGWEVFVWSGPADGFSTLLAQVPGWMSLSMAPLGSDPGAGSISIPLSSPIFWQPGFAGGPAYTPDSTPILAQETMWVCQKDGQAVFAFLAETVDRTTVASDETQTVTVSGPGIGKVLNWAMAMPTGWTPQGGRAIVKTGSIADTFDISNGVGGFVIDTGLWNLTTPGAATIPTSGTAVIALTTGGAFLGGGPFDISNSSISASITPANTSGTPNGSEVTELIVRSTTGVGYALIGLSYQEFYAQYESGNGSITTHNIAAGVVGGGNAPAYNAGAHQYWRISADLIAGGGVLWRFWTSGDGASWVMQWSISDTAHPFPTNSINVYMGGSYSPNGQATMSITSINGEVAVSPSAGPIFVTEPIMEVYYQLLQAAQARGTLQFVSPTFGASTDSNGQVWTDSWSIQVPIGTDLLTLMTNYAGAIGGDWQMYPGFQLAVGVPGSLGSQLESTIVFHEGEVTELGRTQTRDQIYNVVAAQDGAGVVWTEESTASIAQWGQRESYTVSGGTIDAQSAVNTAEAALQQLDQEVSARVMQIPPNQPGKTAFVNFNVFDWIGIERGDFSAIDTLRVIGITVTVDQDGGETHELILQTYRQYVVQYLQYLVNKFGGQSASTLGALPAGTTVNGSPAGILGSVIGSSASQPTGTGSGSSSAGLVVATSLSNTAEVGSGAAGSAIPGSMITSGSIPASTLSFNLPSGVNATFSQVAPGTPNNGDLWYQVNAQSQVVTLYQWNSSLAEFVPFAFNQSAVSFNAANIGGTQVFVQSTAPTGTINNGSLWWNTASGYQLNVWAGGSGGAWQAYQWGTGSLAENSVTAGVIAAGTITGQQIAANTITSQHIGADMVTATQIAAGAVTAEEVAAGAITAGAIAAGAIDGITITGNVINSAQIYGDIVVLSGADDGVFCYGQPASVTEIFNATGATAWVAPAGTTSVWVAAIGAGGGGGDGSEHGGAGGGGGGCGVDSSYGTTPGSTYYAGVGAGGGGGAPGAAGGDSWFNSSNSEGSFFGSGGQGGHADGEPVAGGGYGGGTSGNNGGTSGGDTGQKGGGGGGGGGGGSGSAGGTGLSTSTGAGARGGGGGASDGTHGGSGGGPGGSGGNISPGANGGTGYAPGGGGGGAGTGHSGGTGGNGRVVLVYTGGSTSLIASITGLAGVDPVNGFNVPQGVYTNAIELSPQSSAPAIASAGDGGLWANANGNPQVTLGSGMAMSVASTELDGTSYSSGNNTGPIQISKAWTISAGDAVVGCGYEVEVQFIGTWGTSAGSQLTFECSFNGSTSGVATVNIGGGFMALASTFRGWFRFLAIMTAVGSSGNATVVSTGGLLVGSTCSSGTNNNNCSMAGSNTLAPGGGVNTTTSWNLRVNTVWASSNSGQNVTGYFSKFTRWGP